jgi:hypothetical protein
VTTKHYARRVAGRDVEIADGLEAMHRGRSEAGRGMGRRLLSVVESLQEVGAKAVLCLNA